MYTEAEILSMLNNRQTLDHLAEDYFWDRLKEDPDWDKNGFSAYVGFRIPHIEQITFDEDRVPRPT